MIFYLLRLQGRDAGDGCHGRRSWDGPATKHPEDVNSWIKAADRFRSARRHFEKKRKKNGARVIKCKIGAILNCVVEIEVWHFCLISISTIVFIDKCITNSFVKRRECLLSRQKKNIWRENFNWKFDLYPFFNPLRPRVFTNALFFIHCLKQIYKESEIVSLAI